MDIAALGPAPSPDTAGASADAPAGAPDLFAAILDEAAGTTGDSLEPSDTKGVDDEDVFDEMAALAMTSLLSLSTPVTDTVNGDAIETTADNVVGCQAVPVDLNFWAPPTVADDRAGTDETDASVSEDGVASMAKPTENWSAQQVLTPPTTGDDLANERPIATDAETLTRAAAAVPVSTTEKPGVEKTPDEATAQTANADLPRAAKSVRTTKSTRTEHATAADTASTRATTAQAVSATAAEPSIGQLRDAVRTQGTTEPAPASTAARFARALERAAALATSESASSAPATAGTNSGSGEQSAFSDGSNEGTMPSFAPRHTTGGVSFTIAAPTAIDVRTLARAVDVASHAAETTTTTIPERDVVAQLVQSMRVQFRDGIGDAVVKLKPEHLGSVEISLKVENGVIKATVQAEVAAVRQWIESHQDTLKASLAEQGLRLERFVVEPDGKRQTAGDDAQPREQRRRQDRQRMSDKDHPVFEVTV